jgi:predicted transcriptional regulator
MSKSRVRAAKTVPKPRIADKQAIAAIEPAHLPLQVIPEAASLPSQLPTVSNLPTPGKPAKKRDRTILPSNSLVRHKVLAIVAMKLEGKTKKEIGDHLHLSESSVNQYMWLAGKNGWLKKLAIDPADRLEHEIAHKVVRNLDEMLDSENEDRRDVATLKTAEGMLFKRFGTDAAQAPPLAVIGIRIEMPTGANAPTALREGTTGGAARFVDGQVIEG